MGTDTKTKAKQEIVMDIIGDEIKGEVAKSQESNTKQDNLKPHYFKKGNIANPKGRPVGSKNKKTMLLEILKKHKFDPMAQYVELFNHPSVEPVDQLNLLTKMFPYLYVKPKEPTEINIEHNKTNQMVITFVEPELIEDDGTIIDADSEVISVPQSKQINQNDESET